MLDTSGYKKGDIVGYVERIKPQPIATEGLPLLTYIVEAEANRVTAALRNIEDLGLRPYYPIVHKKTPAGRRRSREIEIAIFPGRIFVPLPLPLTNETWHRVRCSPGVHDFMKIDGHRPATLPDSEMDKIRKTEARLDAKYRQNLAAAEASPYRRGRQVWAEILPGEKMLATIEDLDAKGRVNVLLQMAILGRSVWPVKPHLLQFVEA